MPSCDAPARFTHKMPLLPQPNCQRTSGPHPPRGWARLAVRSTGGKFADDTCRPGNPSPVQLYRDPVSSTREPINITTRPRPVKGQRDRFHQSPLWRKPYTSAGQLSRSRVAIISGSASVTSHCNTGGPAAAPLASAGWPSVNASVSPAVSSGFRVSPSLQHDGWHSPLAPTEAGVHSR